MDFNRTTTLPNRRKTFTVSHIPQPFAVSRSGVCNQTFLTTNGGVMTHDSSNSQFSNSNDSLTTIHNDDDRIDMNTIDNLGEERLHQDVLLSDKYEDVYSFLDQIGIARNTAFEEFDNSNANVANDSLCIFESSSTVSVETRNDELELERLRFQERKLKDEIKELETTMDIEKKRCLAETEKYKKKTAEVLKQAQQNRKASKETRERSRTLKKERENYVMMSKDLCDKNDKHVDVLQKFFNVSSDGLCQDEEFCRQFSGGKCFERKAHKESCFEGKTQKES